MRVMPLALVLAVGWTLCACKTDRDSGPPGPAPPPVAPAPASPDRLPAGKLLEGSEDVFGLRLPLDMTIDARFAKRAHAIGPVDSKDLAEYVQLRVLAAHVEMADRRLVFPKAKVRGAGEQIFRIEILDRGHESELAIEDITPVPRTEGLSDEERWRRAGMLPNGKLADPKNLE